MFLILSKIAGFLLAPSSLIILAGLAGLVLLLLQHRRWGGRLLGGSAVALAVFSLSPVGDLVLASLEHRFPAYRACRQGPAIAGVIVLGGAIGQTRTGGRVFDNLGEAADRVRYAAQLARETPGARVLISAGQVVERDGLRPEANIIADMLVELGVGRDRIEIEAASRTTAENAGLAAAQAGAGSWLLVTSAFHMPRAMGAFRKAGVDVIAAPTDWRVDYAPTPFLASPTQQLSNVDLAAKEYLGLLGYWIGGRSAELFPGPAATDKCPGA